MLRGRKPIYTTDEEYHQAKIQYNKRYYDKKTAELKVKRDKKVKPPKIYTDEKLLCIIEDCGWERLLQLMINK